MCGFIQKTKRTKINILGENGFIFFMFITRRAIAMSQPQKNNGKRAAAKVSGATKKNNNLIRNLLDDFGEDDANNIFVGRVIKKLGNGRMQVFYTTKNEDDEIQPHLDQAAIRGNMRGRSKRSLWIDIGTIVIISKTEDFSGPKSFEIIGVVGEDQLDKIKEAAQLDPRVLAVDITDEASLMTAIKKDKEEGGFEFSNEEEKDVNVENL